MVKNLILNKNYISIKQKTLLINKCAIPIITYSMRVIKYDLTFIKEISSLLYNKITPIKTSKFFNELILEKKNLAFINEVEFITT